MQIKTTSNYRKESSTTTNKILTIPSVANAREKQEHLKVAQGNVQWNSLFLKTTEQFSSISKHLLACQPTHNSFPQDRKIYPPKQREYASVAGDPFQHEAGNKAKAHQPVTA